MITEVVVITRSVQHIHFCQNEALSEGQRSDVPGFAVSRWHGWLLSTLMALSRT